MNINVVNYNTPIKKDEIRITYDGKEKMLLTKYENTNYNVKPNYEKNLNELESSKVSKLNGFLTWVEDICGEDCSINVEDHLLYMIM